MKLFWGEHTGRKKEVKGRKTMSIIILKFFEIVLETNKGRKREVRGRKREVKGRKKEVKGRKTISIIILNFV